MVHRDLVSSLFWAGVGVVFCAGSLGYGFGGAGVPGAGFLPFLTGLSLLALSILNLILSVTKKGPRSAPRQAPGDLPVKEKAKRILVVLGALLFYLLALERLGFALTSLFFLTVVIALDFRKWPLVVLASFSFTAFFFILFRVVLRVPLPLGMLGG